MLRETNLKWGFRGGKQQKQRGKCVLRSEWNEWSECKWVKEGIVES